MQSMKCPTCGQRILNPAGLAVCPNCGASLLPQLTTSIYTSSSDKEDLFSQIGTISTPPDSDADDDDTTLFSPPTSPIRSDSQFPKDFPRRPPDLEGNITLLESHEEPKHSNGIADSVFDTFLDFLWSISGGSSSQLSKEKEKIQVTLIRIRTEDSGQRDIRFEGRLTGVNVAQGDRVSLWGKNRKGLLALQRGYNHTTKGPITTSKMASPRDGFLLILVALAGIAVFLYYHILPWPL